MLPTNILPSWSRTFHTYQGLQAGPPQKGKPEHLYHRVILDPDKRDTEKTQTGLLYTGISRGTTLGDQDGLNSAVYFDSEHFSKESNTRDRVLKLTLQQNNIHEFTKVTKRRQWVNHLESNTQDNKNPNAQQCTSVFAYFKSTISYDTLYERQNIYTS